MKLDRYGQFKPEGPEDWYKRRTSLFSRTCPFSPQARDEFSLAEELFPKTTYSNGLLGKYLNSYAGYVLEDDFRIQGNSGGMVSWLLSTLLRQGYIDGVIQVSRALRNARERCFFKYSVSSNQEGIRQCAKSRYYPVELSSTLSTIKEHPGRYALVGLPCYIKAARLLCSENELMGDRIRFMIGLVCGHMKSACFLESIAVQSGTAIDDVKSFDFRIKEPGLAARNYVAQFTRTDGIAVRKEWWDLVDGDWGAGFFQNSACDFCDDVVAETADVSLGDAWVEPYASDPGGNNVVIVRTDLLHHIPEDGVREKTLFLNAVEPEFVEQTQAAGFRQRREGLAYRLSCSRKKILPGKRVTPQPDGLSLKRKMMYRIRSHISYWSHRVFRMAILAQRVSMYEKWARSLSYLYKGFAYEYAAVGALLKYIERHR